MVCKKCTQQISHPTAHTRGCAVVLPSPAVGTPEPTLSQIDKMVGMMGSVMEKLEGLNSRLENIEHPKLVKAPIDIKKTSLEALESNFNIAKGVHEQEKRALEGAQDLTSEKVDCKFGIHYPSDWGQKRVNGLGYGELTPPTKRCFPAPVAIRQIVDEILGDEFGADVLPDSYNSTFEFSIIIPPHYCIKEDYRNGNVKDIRPKIIANHAAEQEVKTWCTKVKEKIYKEHVQYQLPSPFTGYARAPAPFSGYRDPAALTNAPEIPYKITQVA